MVATDRFQFVKVMLERYKSVTMEPLLERLPVKEPRRYLYDLVPLYPRRSGKGFRPGLCIATCGAFGGTVERAYQSAVAIELFHNAFLVHDDVEDGSETRRGYPTLSAEQGAAVAINVGDAMNVLSIGPLMENLETLGPTLTWQVFKEIEHMARQSVEGQAMELGWVRDNPGDLTDEDYLRMVLKKTCWYTCIHPCRIGALIGTGGAADLSRFDVFGYYMGAAFQIQDDLLNLLGEEAKYGKEIGGDIWEGKRTLVLIHAINQCAPDEKARILSFLAQPRAQRLEADVRWVYQIIEKYGSIDYARSCARQLAGAALREFFVIYGKLPDSEHKQFLFELIVYMIERDL
ncbi:MAG TPA: polyprenyl synthetase family protein [Anaerolineales bacterium]|nr:polyprenyl synthetase family protein [Anaerolineales bacterium]